MMKRILGKESKRLLSGLLCLILVLTSLSLPVGAAEVTSFNVSFTGVSATSGTGWFIANLAEKLPTEYIKQTDEGTGDQKIINWEMPVTLVSELGQSEEICQVYSFYKNGDTTNSGNLWFNAQDLTKDLENKEGTYLTVGAGSYRDKTGSYELKIADSAAFIVYAGGGGRWAYGKTFDVTLGKAVVNVSGGKFITDLGATKLPDEYTIRGDFATSNTGDQNTMRWEIPIQYATAGSDTKTDATCRVDSFYKYGDTTYNGDLFFKTDATSLPYDEGTEYYISAGTYWGTWIGESTSTHAGEKFALVLDKDYVYRRVSGKWELIGSFDASLTGVTATSGTGWFIANLAEKLPTEYIKESDTSTGDQKVINWEVPVTLVSESGQSEETCQVYSFYKNGDTTNSGNLWFNAQSLAGGLTGKVGNSLIVKAGSYYDKTGLYELKIADSPEFVQYAGGGGRWAIRKTFDVTLGKAVANVSGGKFITDLGTTKLPDVYTIRGDFATSNTGDQFAMRWQIPIQYTTSGSDTKTDATCQVDSFYKYGDTTYNGDLFFKTDATSLPYDEGTEYYISAGTYWGTWIGPNTSANANGQFALVLDRDYIYRRVSNKWELVNSFDTSLKGISWTSASCNFIADLSEKLPTEYIKVSDESTSDQKVINWELPVTLVSESGTSEKNCKVYSFYKNGDTTNSGNLWFDAAALTKTKGDYIIIEAGSYRNTTGLYELKIAETATFVVGYGTNGGWSVGKIFNVTLGSVLTTTSTGKFITDLGTTKLPDEYTIRGDFEASNTGDQNTMRWEIPIKYTVSGSDTMTDGTCRVESIYKYGEDTTYNGDLFFKTDAHGLPTDEGTAYIISAGTYWGEWIGENTSAHAGKKFALVLDKDYVYRMVSGKWVLMASDAEQSDICAESTEGYSITEANTIIDGTSYEQGTFYKKVGVHTLYYYADGKGFMRDLVVYMEGDTDVNGVTDVRDLVRMKRYLAKDTGEPPTKAAKKSADLNADDSLTNDDATMLRQLLAKKKMINYGLGEPASNLWGDKKMYTDTTFNAQAAGAFGVSTYRIWVPSCAQAYPNVDGSYRLVFDNSKLDILKDFVAKLKAQGVTRIVAKPTSHIIARDYAKYVGADGNLYTTEGAEAEAEKGTSGVKMVYQDYYAVPDPATESEAYAAFLKIQEMYFQQLSEQIPEITHFETINEPDGGASVRRTGRYCSKTDWTDRGLTMPDSWTPPASYTTQEVAKICMDYNAAAMQGVRAADNGAKVLAPALTATDQGPELLQAFYRYIASQADHNPDNYFDYLNWHPYVFLTQDGDGRVAANSDDWYGWYDKWVTWQKKMHAIAENAGDAGRKVWFTEMGVTDCGEVAYPGTTTGSQPITQTMAAERFAKMCELAEAELPFVDTIIAFRLTDTPHELTYAKSYEGNFGMFEYFGNEENSADCLKQIAKTFYGIVNDGSTDYTRLYAVLDKCFADAKSKLE